MFQAAGATSLTDISCGFSSFDRPTLLTFAVDFFSFSRFGKLLLVASGLSARFDLFGCFPLSSIVTPIYCLNDDRLSASSTAIFPNAVFSAFFSPTVFFFFALLTLSHFQQLFALPPFSLFRDFNSFCRSAFC